MTSARREHVEAAELDVGLLVRWRGSICRVIARQRVDGAPVNDDQRSLRHVQRIRFEWLDLVSGDVSSDTLAGDAPVETAHTHQQRGV